MSTAAPPPAFEEVMKLIIPVTTSARRAIHCEGCLLRMRLVRISMGSNVASMSIGSLIGP